jgi:hypothetical protein
MVSIVFKVFWSANQREEKSHPDSAADAAL